MSEHDDKAYLLRCFEGDVTRRAVLKSLAAMGAGLATLTDFAGHLARATAADAAELTIFCWSGLVPDILKEASIAPFRKTRPRSRSSSTSRPTPSCTRRCWRRGATR